MSANSIVILLHYVHQMVMENLEMMFAIAISCLSVHHFLLPYSMISAFMYSISLDKIESDKFKIGNMFDSGEDFI